MQKKKFLDFAYGLEGAEQTQAFYRDWAETYDEEINANGYASPQRTADAFACCGVDFNRPLLDIGCGSGVSGECLQRAGFVELHGSDFSRDMLTLAEQKKLYTQLHLADLNDPFSFVESPYHTVAAIGVLAPGHAGPAILHSVLGIMAVGGLFGFSMNDHTLQDSDYMDTIDQLIRDQKIRLRFSEYGDHLPGINLKSMITVIEKRRE